MAFGLDLSVDLFPYREVRKACGGGSIGGLPWYRILERLGPMIVFVYRRVNSKWHTTMFGEKRKGWSSSHPTIRVTPNSAFLETESLQGFQTPPYW